MARYIDKETMRGIIREQEKSHGIRGLAWIEMAMDKQEDADVQEVRHGHWIKFKIQNDVYEHMKCSNCSFYWSMPQHSNIFLRCPHCGATMDEEEK